MRASVNPDWRDVGAYAWLRDVERGGFAWEWLRRSRLYREAALEASLRPFTSGGDAEDALAWNLHRFEDPSRPYDEARPIWGGSRHPWVVSGEVSVACRRDEALDPRSLLPWLKIVKEREISHLLLSDSYRSIRLDLSGMGDELSPVGVKFCLSGILSLQRSLLVLQRLHYLAKFGRFPKSLFSRPKRAERWILQLRAFDGLNQGATQADLAEVLLSPMMKRPAWRIHSPSLRTRAQRLAKSAKSMAAGDFWNFLD